MKMGVLVENGRSGWQQPQSRLEFRQILVSRLKSVFNKLEPL